jgi:hypothetical protein
MGFDMGAGREPGRAFAFDGCPIHDPVSVTAEPTERQQQG